MLAKERLLVLCFSRNMGTVLIAGIPSEPVAAVVDAILFQEDKNADIIRLSNLCNLG